MTQLNMKQRLYFLVTAILAVSSAPAHAYMGAGAGLSAIGSILSFLGVFLLMVIGFVWFPVKRFIAKLRNKDTSGEDVEAEAPE